MEQSGQPPLLPAHRLARRQRHGILGQGGDRHTYRLSIREAMPDFQVSIEGQNANVPAGSGRNFTLRVDRHGHLRIR